MSNIAEISTVLKNANAAFKAERFAEAITQFRRAREGVEAADLDAGLLHDINFYIAKSMMLSGAEHAALLGFAANEAEFEQLPQDMRDTREDFVVDRLFCQGVVLQNRKKMAEAAERYRRLLERRSTNLPTRRNFSFIISCDPENALGDLTPVLFSTLPRSGTWYSYHVFEFFERSLAPEAPAYTPGELQIATLVFPRLNIYKGHLHTLCPGFRASYDGPLRQKWEALVERTPHEYYSVDEQCYDPTRWPQARILYLYRNPLDQLSSLFSLKKRARLEEKDWSKITGEEFLRGPEGVAQFILQYVTFSVMRQLKPDNVAFFRYEDLMRDPMREYEAMLRFIGIALDEGRREGLREAIAASSISEMQAIEEKGKPVSGVPLQQGASHLDGGATGRWRKSFDEGLVAYVRESLAEFDIDLDRLMREAGSPLT